jgi:hypothetical protein
MESELLDAEDYASFAVQRSCCPLATTASSLRTLAWKRGRSSWLMSKKAGRDALDERFRVATAPIKLFDTSQSLMAGRARWWRFRYPLMATGDPSEQLPPTWSPAPIHIE